MDIRSAVLEGHPEVERAARRARWAGYGSWLVGWALFAFAAWARDPWAFALFASWYLALGLIVAVSAAIPRRRQSLFDLEWAHRFRELAIRDDLTGLYNRRYFNSELEAQIPLCRQSGRPLSLALIDLDNFKAINDSFGHPAGDMALRIAGQAIVDASPAGATVARVGGDEFAVVMPGIPEEEAEATASRIRQAIEASNFVIEGNRGGRGQIRATVGIAVLGATEGPGKFLQEADSALYAGKRTERAA